MKMRFYDFVAKTLATHTSLQLAAEMKSNFRQGWLLCWYFLICFNLQTPIKSATRLRANRATLQVFMSPPIAAQSYWQTGTLIPVLRPVADYMDVQYNPENLDVLITKQAGMANSPRMNVKNGKTVEKADKLDKQKTWHDFRSSGLYILGLPMHSQCGDKCVSALTLGKAAFKKWVVVFFNSVLMPKTKLSQEEQEWDENTFYTWKSWEFHQICWSLKLLRKERFQPGASSTCHIWTPPGKLGPLFVPQLSYLTMHRLWSHATDGEMMLKG